MLKLTVAVLAVALAGTASAAGWRSLRIDASSEAAFEESLAKFDDKLSPGRRYAFGEALEDIRAAVTQAAHAEQRAYTDADFYREVDGLGYEEIVRWVDPTGKTARRDRAAYRPVRGPRRAIASAAMRESPWPTPPPPVGFSGERVRGGTPLFGPGRPPE